MITLSVETVKEIVNALNLGFNVDDCDVYGIFHNDVTDLCSSLETMIEEFEG